LFEEADGLWLSMQGKSKGNSSKGKKELKVGVVYEAGKRGMLHPKSTKRLKK